VHASDDANDSSADPSSSLVTDDDADDSSVERFTNDSVRDDDSL